MRGRLFALVALVVVVVAAISIVWFAGQRSPSGEVVTLVTYGSGGKQETSLWVVEEGGQLWLRADYPASGWVERLRENPQVSLTRGEETRRYRAEPVESSDARERINASMAEKYGSSGSFVEFFGSHDKSIPIRLHPRPS